jgi:hypothetical protein
MKQLIATACLTFIAMNAILAMQFAPRLIGFGCNGSSIPMLARYESDFPRCDDIRPLTDMLN